MIHLLAAMEGFIELRHVIADLGRKLAVAGGWYDERRVAQVVMVALLAAALVIGVGVTGWIVRGRGWAYGIALGGTTLTLGLLLAAAISLHGLELVMDRPLGYLPVWGIGLVLGNGAVIAGSVRAARDQRAKL